MPVTSTGLRARVRRADLLDALTFSKLAVPSRPPVPILAGVRLTGSGSSLSITGFNYEALAARTIGAESADGEIVTSHASLLAVVKPLKADVLDLETDGSRLRIVAGRTRFHVPLLDLEEYPATPQPLTGEHVLWTTGGADLLDTITKMATAASGDFTLPLLTCINFAPVDGRVVLYSTDRYRLARFDVAARADLLDVPVKVPARALLDAARLFKTSGAVSVLLSPAEEGLARHLALSDGQRYWSHLLVEGDYPTVERLFPDAPTVHVTLASKDVLDAVKQVGPAIERNTPVALRFGAEGTTVYAGSPDSIEAEAPIAGIIRDEHGEVPAVAFNPTFLAEGVKALGGDVTLSMTHKNKPVLFTSPDVPGFKYLLVPIRFAA